VINCYASVPSTSKTENALINRQTDLRNKALLTASEQNEADKIYKQLKEIEASAKIDDLPRRLHLLFLMMVGKKTLRHQARKVCLLVAQRQRGKKNI
jgi:hypothetical protein